MKTLTFLMRLILTWLTIGSIAAYIAVPSTNPQMVVISITVGTLFLTMLWSVTFPWEASAGQSSAQQQRDDAELIRLIRLVRALDADDNTAQREDAPVPYKRKRDTIDNVLRDLSDDQLATLRQRLTDGTIDDEVLHKRILDADGELVQRR